MKESFREWEFAFENRQWTFGNLRFACLRSAPSAGPRMGRFCLTARGRVRLYVNSFQSFVLG